MTYERALRLLINAGLKWDEAKRIARESTDANAIR